MAAPAPTRPRDPGAGADYIPNGATLWNDWGMAKLIYRVSFVDSLGCKHVFERDTANAALAIRRLYEGGGLPCHFECVRVRPVGLPQW